MLLKRQDIRSARTEYAIMEAMFSLLEASSFDKITISDICRSIPICRSTFYLYFEDKFELTIKCMEHYLQPPAELFKGGSLEPYFELLLSKAYDLRVPLRHIIQLDGNQEIQVRICAMYTKLFYNYFARLENHGAYLEASADMMAIFNCGGITNLLWWWIQNDFPIPQDDLIRYLIRIVNQSHELIHF